MWTPASKALYKYSIFREKFFGEDHLEINVVINAVSFIYFLI